MHHNILCRLRDCTALKLWVSWLQPSPGVPAAGPGLPNRLPDSSVLRLSWRRSSQLATCELLAPCFGIHKRRLGRFSRSASQVVVRNHSSPKRTSHPTGAVAAKQSYSPVFSISRRCSLSPRPVSRHAREVQSYPTGRLDACCRGRPFWPYVMQRRRASARRKPTRIRYSTGSTAGKDRPVHPCHYSTFEPASYRQLAGYRRDSSMDSGEYR